MDWKTCGFVAATFGLCVTLCGQSQSITGSISSSTRNPTGKVIPKTATTFRHWNDEFSCAYRSSLAGIYSSRDDEEQIAVIRRPRNMADQWQYPCTHKTGAQILTQIALKEIQEALHQDEVILEYALREPSSMCKAITRQSVQRIELASRHVIESEIAAYREDILHGRQSLQIARRLYDLLLAPIAGLERKRRITIIPGGLLHLLPFEALVTPSSDYVINTHMINYSPLAAITLCNRRIPRKPDRHCRLLAVGDPCSPFSKRMEAALFADAPKPASLHGARMEILSITNSLIKAAETVTLLGEDASETGIKALNLADFNILHFAVHGTSDTNHPAGSALVLGSSVDETEDGILQACEVSRLGLNADLVVLSACNTAMGKQSGQDGISDLVHAFLLAGARTVVGSIWPAEDRSTANLMIGFYTYLAQGMDKGSALRQAKLDFVKKYKDNAFPILWAGMIMIGDSSGSIFKDHP